MNSFSLTIWALIFAILAQSIAAGLALEIYLRKDLRRALARPWLAIAIGALLLDLYHGYTLELAMRTGLYDLRQAVLAALIGFLFALGIYGLRRQQA